MERVQSLASLAGSLTLLLADGQAARAWRGESAPGDLVQAFRTSHPASASAREAVTIGEAATGWLVQLGAPPRDATIFRRAAHQLLIVAGRAESKDEDAAKPFDVGELARLVTRAEGERFGTLEVPSGRLIVADAESNLSTGPGTVAPTVPAELRAQAERTLAETAEARGKALQNLDEVRKHIAACPLEDRPEFLKLIRELFQQTAEAASASLELFGGTSSVIRPETGDIMLVVPPRTYELAWLAIPVQGDSLRVLRIEPA
jgi:hypothetical protein